MIENQHLDFVYLLVVTLLVGGARNKVWLLDLLLKLSLELWHQAYVSLCGFEYYCLNSISIVVHLFSFIVTIKLQLIW